MTLIQTLIYPPQLSLETIFNGDFSGIVTFSFVSTFQEQFDHPLLRF